MLDFLKNAKNGIFESDEFMDEQKRKNRLVTLVFSILAFAIFNLIMYLLIKV